ncbi:hypothetical protein [Cloacibacterium normanense]|uniref:Glycosyl transferases group 1 family protein n=1 Tax=Cloacibacterium normanense TaxID=237258 RepID=A0A1E5UFJ1_9FLAO|nr:hypothetical protein [Cloacibacterium normanense]AZI68791.1 hypothetical protein EB819_02440 [Cloacibacterium normanense]OEL11666.1 hypothetical protein BHF72_1802 [Cloacibacterium normanense]SDO70283.1 hypothetical protein SAMN04489756_11466 [Cloacibacterium normanense]
MKKIAYIELDTHAEIALNFMELIQDSKAFSVDYYFSEKILRFFGFAQNDKLPENIKKATPENLIQQLSTDNYQLIIIGTVHRYFNVFEEVAEKFNTSIICHNLNFVKASNFDLLSSVFKEDFQFRLKLLLKEGLLRKSKVYEKAKNLLVLDRGFDSAQPDKYKFLPIFYTKFLEKPKNETYTIVIPGAVSQKRRDYEKVLKSIIKFHFPFEIIFLGKASGKELEMLQDFEQSKPENISIKYFKEKVPQDVFDDYMQKADVLWCSIQQETEFFSQKEIYGITKMSGNIGDAVKFGKLAVFPEDYPSKYSFIIPEKGSLGDFLFTKKDVDFSEFSKEKVLQELEKTIFALL